MLAAKVLGKALWRKAGELGSWLYCHGRNYLLGGELFGFWHCLGAKIVQIKGRREPHTLMTLGHPRKELWVLSKSVMRPLEVVAGGKVMMDSHPITLSGVRFTSLGLVWLLPLCATRGGGVRVGGGGGSGGGGGCGGGRDEGRGTGCGIGGKCDRGRGGGHGMGD